MAERRSSSSSSSWAVYRFILKRLVGVQCSAVCNSSSNSNSTWDSLNEDVVDSILTRLVSLSDLVSFSAVCKSWNYMALNHYKEKRIQQINHQLPWLIIQPLNEGLVGDPRLYNLTSSQICNFQFQIPPLLNRRTDYHGSSHGWLFIWDYINTAVKMFNPISGTMFPLPPFIPPFIIYGKLVCRPKRVTLSRHPSSTQPPFEVLACSSSSDIMAHWKFGDKFWSYLEKRPLVRGFHFYDFIFYKHRKLGIGYSTTPELIDVISINNIDNTQTLKFETIASTQLEGWLCVEAYLVETTKGDLLMVQTNLQYSTGDRTYRVYKLIIASNDNDDSGAAKVIPITNLDGECFFLGDNNHSISVLASNYPAACIPNSIYYATSRDSRGSRVEVFNMEDGRFYSRFSPTHSVKVLVTPWIVPSMKLL